MAALEAMGAEVWEPFARNNQIDRAGAGWAYEIGQADLRDVREADGLFAVVNGCPPDEGVMVELGLAIAWEKPVFLFRDDFRRCTDSEAYPLNLMLFTSLPEMGWDAYWYSSAQEIANPDKGALAMAEGRSVARITPARRTRPDRITPYFRDGVRNTTFRGVGRCTPPGFTSRNGKIVDTWRQGSYGEMEEADIYINTEDEEEVAPDTLILTKKLADVDPTHWIVHPLQ